MELGSEGGDDMCEVVGTWHLILEMGTRLVMSRHGGTLADN